MDYLTEQEHMKLTEELATLIALRPVISTRIGTAREMGDLKENADYHAAKDDQAHNERKIKDLERRLAVVTVADTEHVPEGFYKLVGETTGRFDLDYLEVTPNSPLGEALFKSRVGETVGVVLPAGRTQFEILAIEE